MSASTKPLQVVIIDSGGYNIGSVMAALQRLRVQAVLSNDGATIEAASHVILPGVGHAAAAMRKLKAAGLDQLIPALKQPVLGICLGLQLLYEHSAEGNTQCLGVLPGTVSKLHGSADLRIPHMGWNRLQWPAESALQQQLPTPAWMYFVHSYAAPINHCTVASVSHGVAFTALAQRDNFLAAQFHPERSAQAGAALFSHFLSL
ncbi:MAG: imidazole glycerol phosphate synthase subunit HisH [Gammaproteobacteria bacterium]|nr:imidazole glycerol phosphate synthase subunit HisH [Gammaproteobacteria bacterium]